MYLVRKNVVTTKQKDFISKGISILKDAGVWENIKCFETRKGLNEYMKKKYTKIENRYDRYGEYMYTKVTEYVVYETFEDEHDSLPKIIRVSELNPKYEMDMLIKSIKDEDYDDLKSKNGYYKEEELINFLTEEYNLVKMARQNKTYYFKTRILNENEQLNVLHIDLEETKDKDGVKVVDVY